MFLFSDKFEIDLNITREDFVDKLLKITEIRDDLINDIFPKKKKDFIGKINYNNFSIVLNRSSFVQNNYEIFGQIVEDGDKIQIVGSIKGYKLLFLFVIAFTLFSFGEMIINVFFDTSQEYLGVFYLILTLIGLLNIYLGIRGLRKYKNRFIEIILSII